MVERASLRALSPSATPGARQMLASEEELTDPYLAAGACDI